MKTTIYAAAAIAGGVLAAGLGAGAAHAAVLPAHHGGSVTATTVIVNRLDSGGNGNWAYDSFKRVVTWNYLGKVTPAQITADPALAATPYEYDATIADTGTFKDIPGAFTPNQGGRDAGDILKPTQVGGPMSGFGDFAEFYTSAKVNSPRTFANLGVPRRLSGPVQNALYPSYTWPELAFPAGTTFAGLNEFDFGYKYVVPATTTYTFKHELVNGKWTLVKVAHHHAAQTWNDTAANGDGQLRYDGNITGR
jgi:hypothetical protein